MPAENLKASYPEHWIIGKIPVRNVWLLLLYASDLLKELKKLGTSKVAVEENPDDIAYLVAEILAYSVERRLRRNLGWSYRQREAILSRVRGRINLMYTERHKLLELAKIACRFDEMTVDTIRNRYVRAALEHIAVLLNRDRLNANSKKRWRTGEKKRWGKLESKCRALARTMLRMGVVGEKPSRNDISTDRFGRNDAGDKAMVAAAHLAFQLSLPTEDLGKDSLPRVYRDELRMWELFEKAATGFYGVVLPSVWRVNNRGRVRHWPLSGSDAQKEHIRKILPRMEIDIELDNVEAGRRIIIDTKFTPLLKDGYRRKQSLHSGYIYQIYAYLRSQEGIDELADSASGMLLHPSTGTMINEYAVIQGHKIHFATVDLTATYKEIRRQLLEVVGASE